MTTGEKIVKVLDIKRLSIAKANTQLGLGGGTLQKIIERKGGWHSSTEEKFLRHFNINSVWWETGKGEVFNENLAPVSKVEETPTGLERNLAREIVTLNNELRDCREENQRLQAEVDALKGKKSGNVAEH